MKSYDQLWPDPSVANSGCVISGWPEPPTVVVELAGGSIEYTRAGWSLECPVFGTPDFRNSDAYLTTQSTLYFEFSPPVTAFFTYVSEAQGVISVDFRLFDESLSLIDTFTRGYASDNFGRGIGFTSTVPVARLRVDINGTQSESAHIGAGTALHIDESSLGTVLIPDYGWEVDYDFGVVFGFFIPTCDSDITNDGYVDILDFLNLLAAWGPCP